MGLVADLVEVAGAGVGVRGEMPELLKLLFVPVLLEVHELLEHQVLYQIAWHILVQRQRVCGKLLF